MHDICPRYQIIKCRIRIPSEAIRQDGEYVTEPAFRVQPVCLGRLQQRKYNHAGTGPSLGITEKPVLPANHNRTDGVLHLVIADLNLAVIRERTNLR